MRAAENETTATRQDKTRPDKTRQDKLFYLTKGALRMEAKRKNSFELSADTRILINVIEKALIKEARETISYSELSAAIGRDVQLESRGLLKTARKNVERDNHVMIVTITNEGIALSKNYNGALSQAATKIRRTKRKYCKLVQNAIVDKELPPEESIELMGRFSALEVTELFTKPNMPKKLLDYIKDKGPKELPTAETLKLFT